MRLQKYLRDQGFGSRRHCEELIERREVIVNGQPVRLGLVLADGDKIECRGKTFIFSTRQTKEEIYLLFNKPAGIVSSRKDEYGRKTVYDLLESAGIDTLNLNYAGRLDYQSRGLMIFSTDGQFIQKLSHPSSGKTKEYLVKTTADVYEKTVLSRSKGFSHKGISYAPFKFKLENKRLIRFTLSEGKKREIRMIVESMNNEVADLLRIRIGSWELDNLKEGEWRYFRP